MVPYLSSAIRIYFKNYAGIEKECWQRIFLTFLNDATAGFCFFLSLYFVEILHLSVTESGIILSFYGLGTVVGGSLSGKLSDHFNPRYISIYSLLLKAVTFFILIKIKLIYMLILNVFILGITTYGFKTSNNVWVLKNVASGEANKLQALNMLYTASNIGMGFSALIITFVASFGFQFVFLLSGTILLFAAFYLAIQDNNSLTRNSAKDLIANNADIKTHKQIKNNKQIMWFIMISIFLTSLVISQLSSTYPIFIHSTFHQFGMKSISFLFILNTIIIGLFQTPLVNYFGHYNKLLISGVGAFLIGFGFFVLNLSHFYILAIVSCIIFTLGEMLFFLPRN